MWRPASPPLGPRSLFIENFESLRQQVPGLISFASDPSWGSEEPNFRNFLYQHLCQKLQISDPLDVLNLRPLVRWNDYSISISHCPSLGAYVLANRPIGFDVEDSQRISESVCRRIQNKADAIPLNAWDLFWCAKEAALKCADQGRSTVLISEVCLTWEPRSEGVFWRFQWRIQDQQSGNGIAWRRDSHAFAIAFSSPS